MTAEPKRPPMIVPGAAAQTSLRPEEILHSGNAGLTIHRTGQIKNEFRSGGREFAREVAQRVNETQVGVATVFLYEEFFGVHDRLHWLIHMRSLVDYPTLIAMAVADEGFRSIFLKERIPPERGGGDWGRMFVDGGVEEHVIVPREPGHRQERSLHSADAALIIQRTALPSSGHRRAALRFADDLADHINRQHEGAVSVGVFEERFGQEGRLHWLIHLESLGVYDSLAATLEDDRQLGALVPAEHLPAGGDWRALFAEGSLHETVLMPQFAGSQGTETQ